MPPSPDESVEVHHDPMFYSDHIVFLVENCLFKVPKRPFLENSTVFEDMFSLPANEASAEGDTDDKPIRLEGIQKEEFRSLMRAMFEPYYAQPKVGGGNLVPSIAVQELSMEEWIHVLKLTTMWECTALRAIAISKLTSLLEENNNEGVLVRWLCLAREYGVQQWVFPALHALARRAQAIQLEEVEPLGIATAIKLAEIRESYAPSSYNTGYHSVPSSSRMVHNFSSIIRKLFSQELAEAEKGGR
ncbi:hypothetical protein PYCCODRAFT_1468633 [Trametes coccinea BRFM310]|uniref:BTB domain-containing protein n=1 Tax=Trametes coccinea (strain BRFM310) TaxID=1353009 RepID=A0A1Y2ILE8_TRAC3|nr:hypothetical protein PYCCODRAFT_1468633 [Trametes coccinea BRFM310]